MLKSNFDGCADKRRCQENHNGNCVACYFGQVDEKNNWTGSERCWNAQCVVRGSDEQ